jgi:hypothetical protein
MYEDHFILNAARLNLSEENIATLKKIPKKNIDWPLFEKKAYVHGVDTFIYYSLKNHNLSELIPPETYKRFQEHYYQVAYQNSVFLDEVDKLSAIIDDKIVLLKGIDLIQSLYPNIAIRSMVDIDILVENGKEYDIWNKLKQNGFKDLNIYASKSSVHTPAVPTPSIPNPNDLNAERPYHLPGLDDELCHIEVHWTIFPDFSNLTDMAWGNAVLLNSNRKIYQLSIEFLLIHLCSHFWSHNGRHIASLRQLCDINELIIKNVNSLDWNEINKICLNKDFKKRITTTLTYSHVLLNTSVPENFIDEEFIKRNSFNLDILLEGMSKSHFSTYRSTFRSINRPSDKIIFIYRTVIPLKDWINAHYQTHSRIELLAAYFKYWLYLFNSHIFKRKVHLGN